MVLTLAILHLISETKELKVAESTTHSVNWEASNKKLVETDRYLMACKFRNYTSLVISPNLFAPFVPAVHAKTMFTIGAMNHQPE